MISKILPLCSIALCLSLLSGCDSVFDAPVAAPPQIATHTKSGDLLASLPPAKNKIPVAVYDFQDQTGQMKTNDTFADYSHAVTQGGIAILNKALFDAGHKNWFTVIDRSSLNNIVSERQIIKLMRGEYQDPRNPMPNIKPMLYAGIIINGGIIAYESNIITGGAGAKYLGVGGSTQYRRDIATVYLRAINSQTGEVLLTVNTSKTIYSTAVSASAFRYVSLDKLLELESGFTVNEPPQFAVRQAIEMGVYALIMEGAIDRLWEFGDREAGKVLIAEYLKKRDGDAAANSEMEKYTPKPSSIAASAPSNSASANSSANAAAIATPVAPPVVSRPVTARNVPAKPVADNAVIPLTDAATDVKISSQPLKPVNPASDDPLPFYNQGVAATLSQPASPVRKGVTASPLITESVSSVPDAKTALDAVDTDDTVHLQRPSSSQEKILPDNRYSSQNYNWVKSSKENCAVYGGCDAGTNP